MKTDSLLCLIKPKSVHGSPFLLSLRVEDKEKVENVLKSTRDYLNFFFKKCVCVFCSLYV